ncbi:MAG: hypothetical protein LWW90_08655 [Candidatus Desulfofervidus auxilii]|nr:hypothetical protein [Candidatus Desulfofervidus auxilii]
MGYHFKRGAKRVIIGFLWLFLVPLSSVWGNGLVPQDLLNYINVELTKVTPLETEAMEYYESVTGENYKDDLTTYNVLKDKVIPTYNNFREKLKNIKPSTEEVKNFHKTYIETAEMYYQAFTMLLSALEKKDEAVLKSANKNFEQAREAAKNLHDSLKKLCQKYGLKLKDSPKSVITPKENL